jgi:uncharacterized membrane protein
MYLYVIIIIIIIIIIIQRAFYLFAIIDALPQTPMANVLQISNLHTLLEEIQNLMQFLSLTFLGSRLCPSTMDITVL